MRDSISNSELYLKAMLSMLARQTFPPKELSLLVGRDKQIEAYNLCDGTRSQGEVAKQLGLDPGNFSKTVGRWVELGVLIRVSEGKEFRPVHLYPIPRTLDRKGEKNG